jgi:hypothetical protein
MKYAATSVSVLSASENRERHARHGRLTVHSVQRHAAEFRTGFLFVRFQTPPISSAHPDRVLPYAPGYAGAVQAAPDAGFMGGNQMQAFLYRLRQGVSWSMDLSPSNTLIPFTGPPNAEIK